MSQGRLNISLPVRENYRMTLVMMYMVIKITQDNNFVAMSD